LSKNTSLRQVVGSARARAALESHGISSVAALAEAPVAELAGDARLTAFVPNLLRWRATALLTHQLRLPLREASPVAALSR